LIEEYSITKKEVATIMNGRHFAFTTDGWKSLANLGYDTFICLKNKVVQLLMTSSFTMKIN